MLDLEILLHQLPELTQVEIALRLCLVVSLLYDEHRLFPFCSDK